MLYNVYSVYDIHNGYGVPAVHGNDATAMRVIANVISGRDHIWYTHCADFYLDCIGTFDTDTGELDSIPPRRVANCSDLVNMIDERGVFSHEV